MDTHLKNTYGHNTFRPSQKDIIEDLLAGNHVSAIMPTGFGKSLLYEFPATYTSKISIIVSPLISLINDQVSSMTAKGISCVSLCGLTKQCSYIGQCKCKICKATRGEGNLSLIYTTPEWIATKGHTLQRIIHKVCLIAIDEAHCISQWSHDFRPSYKTIVKTTSLFPHIPLLVVTATATPRVLTDIYDILNFESVSEYSLGTRRDNLAIRVLDKSMWDKGSINPDENTIIYTQTRKECEKIARFLSDNGLKCLYYHAGLSSDTREKAHEEFIHGSTKIIVATVSFGMGIDKADIRHVINYGVPTDLETYYQEIGRAGRDGLPAKATVYYNDSDFGTASYLISKGAESQVSNRMSALSIFRQYLSESETCRQQVIDNYFKTGKYQTEVNETAKCGICDNCSGTTPGVMYNIAEDAYAFLLCMKHQSHNVGITKTIEFGKTVGTKAYIRILINALVHHGYIESYSSKWGQLYRIKVPEKLVREDTIMCRVPEKLVPKTKSVSKYAFARTTLAKKYNLPEQTIMNDKVLDNIAKTTPISIQDLWMVDGVSSDFLKKYGSEWLTLIASQSKVCVVDKQYHAVKSNKFSQIFESLDECISKSAEITGAKHKSFKSKNDAERWINTAPSMTTIECTMKLVEEGKSIEEIVTTRDLTRNTVENHICEYWGKNIDEIDFGYTGLSSVIVQDILNAITKTGCTTRLRPVMENVTREVSWLHIKLVRSILEQVSEEKLLEMCK
jgi:ATP-dependent DNA helicase RecQ